MNPPTGTATPEQLARETIDAVLAKAGWAVQDRDEMNLAAGPGVAVREFQTDACPCDYLLFRDRQLPLAVVEAKDNKHALGAGMQQAPDAHSDGRQFEVCMQSLGTEGVCG